MNLLCTVINIDEIKKKTWDELYFTQLENLNNKMSEKKKRNFFTL